MRNLICLLLGLAVFTGLAGTALAQITLTGEAYVDASGDLRYKSGDALIRASDGGSGTEADPYIFDLGSQDLDLNGYHVEGNSVSAANQRTVTWRVGNLLNSGAGGDGSFYSGRVTSPTFKLVNEYDGRVRVYHLDAYRLHGADDLVALGCDEFFDGDGAAVVEWADLVTEALPDDRVRDDIAITGAASRQLTFSPTGPKARRLIDAAMAEPRD